MATKAEIEARITRIEASIDRIIDLDHSYTLSDGQGSTTVQRRRLKELREELMYWERRLTDITQPGGMVSVRVGRR